MEVVFIDDKFSADYLKFYGEHGVVIPTLNQIYSIREVRYDMGKQGLLLEGLNNPKIPNNVGYKVLNLEPSWNIRRFTTLLGDKIEQLEIENFKELQNNGTKEYGNRN